MRQTIQTYIICASFFCGIASAAPIVVDFDSPTDLNLFANAAPANWSVASGVLTAAKDTNLTSINGTYYNSGLSLAANGHSLTLEVSYTSWNGTNLTANNANVIRLGIDSGTADALPDFSGVLQGRASGNRNHTVGNYDGTNLVQSASTVNLPNSAQTFVLETVFTRLSDTSLQMDTTLWNAAKSSAIIAELSRTVTVTAGYFSTPVYAGLFLNGDASPAVASGISVDNFTITAIPEPGTLVLVGVALGSLLLFRRRK